MHASSFYSPQTYSEVKNSNDNLDSFNNFRKQAEAFHWNFALSFVTVSIPVRDESGRDRISVPIIYESNAHEP
jgi:hypothetical protein